MKRPILFLSLGLIVSLSIGLLWLSKENTTHAKNIPTSVDLLTTINQKAKNARSGNQAETEELVKEMIQVSGVTNDLAGFSTDSIIERVGKNESRYRLGQAEGIPEEKIIRTINGLAKKFDLPKYARTNSYEVKKLRLSLLPNFPQLINQKNQGSEPAAVGAKIDSQMSPAEAFFVLTMLMQQKMVNEEYQLTNSERMSKWNDLHNHNPKKPKKDKLQNSSFSNRSNEMRTALENGMDAISTFDALQLADITLNTLGIERLTKE